MSSTAGSIGSTEPRGRRQRRTTAHGFLGFTAAIVAWSALACGSPTSPGECHNGRDGYGRGPATYMGMRCTPIGSDVQCQSTLSETGYCATSGSRDITAVSQWLSSNPSVATFTIPGLLKVLAPGEVAITATYGSEGVTGPDFTVAPGAIPEQMVNLLVTVEDAAIPNKRIPDASIDVIPERGPRQTCQSSSTGACVFWVFPTTVHVRASKPEYQPAEGTAPSPTNSFHQYVPLKLTSVS